MMKKLVIFTFLFVVSLNINSAYAVLSFQEVCVDTYTSELPALYSILCPVIRILNVLILMAGAGFVIMVINAGYRYSMALGDPKGIEGAHNTLTYAVIGFFITIGVYVILRIIGQIFDVKAYYMTVPQLFNSFFTAFYDLLDYANIRIIQ